MWQRGNTKLYKLRTFVLLKMSGCLRKQVVYFDSFHGFRLVDSNPFWFLFPIHKVGVPVSEGNWLVVNRLLKVVKRHLQRQNSTLICFNYIFLGTLLLIFQKFWGGGGEAQASPPPPPCPSPRYGPGQGWVPRSMVSANHWLRGIKTYRLSWHLTRVSANHASEQLGLALSEWNPIGRQG